MTWGSHVSFAHRRYSNPLLVVSRSLYRENQRDSSRWILSHYVSLRDRPLTRKRSIIQMQDPFMLPHGEPLLGLGYNYVCWIEYVQSRKVGRRMRNSEKLEFRIAAFPRIDLASLDGEAPPSLDDNSDGDDYGCSIKTLDISEDILRRARRMTLHESCACIVIWTWAYEVHCFKYA